MKLYPTTGAIKLRDVKALVEKQGHTFELSVPKQADKDVEFKHNSSTSQFIPISPMRISIKELRFIINPVEDPYKAYAEKDVQIHPSVTIVMTLNLSEQAAKEYPGEFPDITVQTTVSAGVIGKIESYPPVEDIHDSTNTSSWIYEAVKHL